MPDWTKGNLLTVYQWLIESKGTQKIISRGKSFRISNVLDNWYGWTIFHPRYYKYTHIKIVTKNEADRERHREYKFDSSKRIKR